MQEQLDLSLITLFTELFYFYLSFQWGQGKYLKLHSLLDLS